MLAARAVRVATCTGSPAIHVLMCAFAGAGKPRPSLPPQDVPPLLMKALKSNDEPTSNSGLRSLWDFAGDTTRFIYKNNRTEFIEDAHQTAQSLPTSFYGAAMHGKAYVMEGEMNFVGGLSSDPWIATQIMRSISSDGRMRRWQWELRKHRRPRKMEPACLESP
jgi:hypothetical protein